MTSREEFVAAMRFILKRVRESVLDYDNRIIESLRKLAVAFAEASGHDKTELLVDCGLEETS